MKKNILFLSTHNLATNPRLVKEIELALDKNYNVGLICFEFNNWSYQLNQHLKAKFSNVKMHIIPAGRRRLLPWAINAITEKSFRVLGKLFALPLPALSQAISRRSNMIIKALKKVDGADWVIAHNPGTLFPALVASQKFKCSVGFDVEDYHPGEGHNKHLQKLSKQLMATILPKMNYVSFASPLIMQQVKNDLNAASKNWFTILNYFPVAEFEEPSTTDDGPVRIVWFSQNINVGRGLELILASVKKNPDKLELHLIGNLNPDFYENYLRDISNIIIHAPMEQKNLHNSLAQFDIGLALEPAKDRNNELAISNKILAYLQSGLYVVATNTPAQKDLLKDLQVHGICFDYQKNNFEQVLTGILKQRELIRGGKFSRFQNFKNRNWSLEAEKLSNAWNGLVN